MGVAFDVVVEGMGTPQPLLVVSGDLDMMTAPIFASSAEHALPEEPGGSLRLDMAKVGFIDSTGINALVHLQKLAHDRGGVVELVASSPYVERVLLLVGLGDMFV